MNPPNIASEVKQKVGVKGRYTFTKAKLEKPEHFALDKQITEVRNRIFDIQATVLAKRQADGFFAWLKRHKTNKEVVGLLEQKKTLTAEMQRLTKYLHNICKTEVQVFDNLVPTVGRTMLANVLTDSTPTHDPLLTHAALGSSGTAPANGNTQLGTETYRNAIASIVNSDNVAFATAFFNATECSGTYAEAGIFSDGTGSANSGVLVSRVLISVTKSTSETLTIDWELTIS